jgi:hypothetical protein
VKTANNWWEVILSLLGSYFRNNKFGAYKRQTTNGHQPMSSKPTQQATTAADSKWESTHVRCIYLTLVLQS